MTGVLYTNEPVKINGTIATQGDKQTFLEWLKQKKSPYKFFLDNGIYHIETVW